jgi:NAD(P)-dependent dehydrogenase (short-subunit alcohol dehydrogenase family)
MTSGGSPRPRALITGASRGLGAALARFLAAEGWDLVLTARGRDPLAATASELETFGGTIRPVAGDVTDPAHRIELERAVVEGGRLDLLVNNASDLGRSPLPALVQYPPDEFARVFRTNVEAPLALVQELLPLLEQSHALVVNISSDAAVGGYPGWGAYGASKAALDLVSLTLAHELRDRGVAVVAVDPGDLRTAMHQAAYPGEDISDRPLPEVTLPFWAWLLHQPRTAISGSRFRAQAERWELPS